MEILRPEFLTLLLNGLLIAIVLTFPILIGLFLLSIIRRALVSDRAKFEGAVLEKLEKIQQELAYIQEHFKP